MRAVEESALPETIENLRQKFGLDALSGIADGDFDVRIDAFETNLHAPAFRREFDGVREEIPDDLLQTVGIAGNRSGLRVEQHLQTDVFRFRRVKQRINRRFDDFARLDELHVEPQFARDYSGNIQNIFDDLRLRTRIAVDGFNRSFRVRLRRAIAKAACSTSPESR